MAYRTHHHDTPEQSPLGKPVHYTEQYDPALLFPIDRKPGRDALGLTGALPFFGTDIWNAYELSWLNKQGQTADRGGDVYRAGGFAEYRRVEVVQAVSGIFLADGV